MIAYVGGGTAVDSFRDSEVWITSTDVFHEEIEYFLERLDDLGLKNILDRKFAQAVLGYFDPILPVISYEQDVRRVNRRHRYKRFFFNTQAIILMIALILLF